MLRMPNPGSDIDTVARIFQELYRDLCDHLTFELDDITKAMIKRRNVTSQGALGEEALKRSTRPNRSLDPLYNQSKMYAEVYRVFGLINSTRSALEFKFSKLGQHLGKASDYSQLIKECLLGLAYPNRAVEVKGGNQVRLFVFILRCMEALDGKISRDEIILGPMSVTKDRDMGEFQALIKNLKALRSVERGTSKAIEELSKKIGIAPTTMGNYTRIPIGALVWARWAEKKKGYFHLTEAGRNVLKIAKGAFDIRINDFDNLDPDLHAPLVRVCFYEILGRAGFNMEPVRPILTEDRKTLTRMGLKPQQQILFSPFQQLSSEDLERIFGEKVSSTVESPATLISSAVSPTRSIPISLVRLREAKIMPRFSERGFELVKKTLEDEFKICGGDLTEAIKKLCYKYEEATKDTFYPLVRTLFTIAGFRCELSRVGVNYARADAWIVFDDDTIPIEIKSPMEESEISTKAVRQALENKIVFLSRKMFPCNSNTCTLVVGFNPPNPRSEVHDLVEDIKKCYDVSVGIFDFRSLLTIALQKLEGGLIMDVSDLKALKGLARVRRA